VSLSSNDFGELRLGRDKVPAYLNIETFDIEVTACGKILNPLASQSQEIGGVWGIGMALEEATSSWLASDMGALAPSKCGRRQRSKS